MRKFYITFLILFYFLLWLTIVNALSGIQKWAILNRFQEKQYDLLFESDLSNFSSEYSDIFSISKKIDLYGSMWWDIENDKKEAQEKKQELVDKIWSLEKSILTIDRDVEKTAERIKQINLDIIQIGKEIDNNSRTIEILKKKIQKNREILLEYLVYIYKKWNTSYSWTEIDNIKSILLNQENIWDLINDLYFKWLIQVTWKKLIDNHRKYISELYLKKVSFEKQEKTFKSLRKQWIIEQKVLKDKKKFKERLLESSKWKQEFYKQYVDKKIKLENEIRLKTLKEKIKLKTIRSKILEKYNCNYVDISKNTAEVRAMKLSSNKCYSINKMIYSESQLTDDSTKIENNNIFSWPVNPYMWISSYFLDPEYKKDFWADHNAIDIKTSQWTAIEAPMDWYVVYLKKPDSQDYAYIALKHYNWYLTVYWHVSEILVDEFEYVEKWQVFARSWWEYWTNWAWFLTTWPHLHFEVFKDKEYIDPLLLMDLTYMKFQKIPENYKIKYYVDFEKKRWYSYKTKSSNSLVFQLEWENEIERQQYLISKYAVWTFNNWQMWIDESLDWGIDPSLVMCIGLAESTLWKNLSTPYNIWNVWNNDRWDRRWYDNAEDWVYAIVYTLNNKYFKDVNSLASLSWAWRKLLNLSWCSEKWNYCYATDTNHWHSNVIKCLAHLKWAYVPDTYNFRLLK